MPENGSHYGQTQIAMKHVCRFFTAAAAVILLVQPGQAAELSPAAFADLGKALQLRLDGTREELGFPGATAAILLGDGRMIKLATGMADVEKGIAMTPDHRIPGGSTGKTYAAAVALVLEEEGVWDLDDKVAGYLGDKPWYQDLANRDSMTLRQLLRHRAGVENYYDLPRFHELIAEMVEQGQNIGDLVREDIIRFIAGVPPLFEPGMGFRYTDVGYILVGEAIEAVTGENYFDILKNRLLDPLGLNLTGPTRRYMSGIAQGHAPTPSPLVPGVTHVVADNGELKFDPEVEFTGGGLVNNVGDMARWVMALYTGSAISPEAAGAIVEPPPHLTEQEGESGNYYGLAVFVQQQPWGVTTWGHGGYFPGYRSEMQYVPDHGFSIAVQINTEVDVWAPPPHMEEPRPYVDVVNEALQTAVLEALNPSEV